MQLPDRDASYSGTLASPMPIGRLAHAPFSLAQTPLLSLWRLSAQERSLLGTNSLAVGFSARPFAFLLVGCLGTPPPIEIQPDILAAFLTTLSTKLTVKSNQIPGFLSLFLDLFVGASKCVFSMQMDRIFA